MDKELAAVKASLGAYSGEKELFPVKSGIGKVNAAVTTLSLIRDKKPDLIINSGCAGGLSPEVKVMDIVIGAEVSYHDVWCYPPNEKGQVQGLPARFRADERLVSIASAQAGAAIAAGGPECKAIDTKIHTGLIVSGDRFCGGKDETDAILKDFPDAKAVDMESAAIAQVCYLEGVPFLSFRAVSDSAYSENSRLEEYYDFWDAVGSTSFNFLKHFIDSL